LFSRPPFRKQLNVSGLTEGSHLVVVDRPVPDGGLSMFPNIPVASLEEAFWGGSWLMDTRWQRRGVGV